MRGPHGGGPLLTPAPTGQRFAVRFPPRGAGKLLASSQRKPAPAASKVGSNVDGRSARQEVEVISPDSPVQSNSTSSVPWGSSPTSIWRQQQEAAQADDIRIRELEDSADRLGDILAVESEERRSLEDQVAAAERQFDVLLTERAAQAPRLKMSNHRIQRLRQVAAEERKAKGGLSMQMDLKMRERDVAVAAAVGLSELLRRPHFFHNVCQVYDAASRSLDPVLEFRDPQVAQAANRLHDAWQEAYQSNIQKNDQLVAAAGIPDMLADSIRAVKVEVLAARGGEIEGCRLCIAVQSRQTFTSPASRESDSADWFFQDSTQFFSTSGADALLVSLWDPDVTGVLGCAKVDILDAVGWDRGRGEGRAVGWYRLHAPVETLPEHSDVYIRMEVEVVEPDPEPPAAWTPARIATVPGAFVCSPLWVVGIGLDSPDPSSKLTVSIDQTDVEIEGDSRGWVGLFDGAHLAMSSCTDEGPLLVVRRWDGGVDQEIICRFLFEVIGNSWSVVCGDSQCSISVEAVPVAETEAGVQSPASVGNVVSPRRQILPPRFEKSHHFGAAARVSIQTVTSLLWAPTALRRPLACLILQVASPEDDDSAMSQWVQHAMGPCRSSGERWAVSLPRIRFAAGVGESLRGVSVVVPFQKLVLSLDGEDAGGATVHLGTTSLDLAVVAGEEARAQEVEFRGRGGVAQVHLQVAALQQVADADGPGGNLADC